MFSPVTPSPILEYDFEFEKEVIENIKNTFSDEFNQEDAYEDYNG